MFDVVVVGNVGVDTNVYLPGADIDFSVESNFTQNLDYVGQAGGYSARGFAQLGKRTAFVGYVGDDHNGRFVRQELAGDGIDLTGVYTDPTGTGRSINFMYRDGRRKNFYDGKDHMSLRPPLDRLRTILNGSKLVHFSIPNWARHLLPLARQAGAVIACDIQDVISADDPYRRDFVNQAGILFFSDANQSEPAKLARTYLRQNPEQIIVVGLGANGCMLATAGGERYFEPVLMDAPVVDTNGAGDSLAVGFLTSYVLDGYSLGDSIHRGQIAARYACTQKASSSSLITAEQMTAYFNC
ncbi:MAG: carbohydrate kinase family protein [Chloroflexota bacterium]|nr:MAG: carbohydrate kinase family protein [Chloroflexota bacterium]